MAASLRRLNSLARPWPLQVLPDRLSMSLFARRYRSHWHSWLHLYGSASLRYAPSVRMNALVPGDVISDSIAFTGIYELDTTRRAIELARQGGLMIDIGANLGYFSLLWASANASNHVIAFEASPRVLGMLRLNVAMNPCGERIRIIPVAAGRSSGRLEFDPGPSEQTGWGGAATQPGAQTITVDMVRVDEYLSAIDGEIALLKIDVEGADTWVLMGCEGLLRARRVREIWFEENAVRMKQLGIGADEARRYLISCGYFVRSVGPHSGDLREWRATLAD